MIYAFGLVAVGLLGFLAGLLSFKVKARWCQEHGVVKTCHLCKLAAGMPVRLGQ